MLISRADFPGAGEDEIAFQRGETIVVIAKDDGFGDGWWTVIPPLRRHYPYVPFRFRVSAALWARFTLRVWGGGVGRWASF